MDKIKSAIFREKTTLLFVVLCICGIWASQQPLSFVLNELVTRFGRNTFLVLSLLIPIQAGMGLNFSIVVGAMAAQIAVFAVLVMDLAGMGGLLACVAICTPLAILFGFLAGNLFNGMKGSEMIGGMIVGYFTDGLYQFLFLFAFGGIITINAAQYMIPGGIGVRGTIDLVGSIRYALDDVYRTNLLDFVSVGIISFILYNVYRLARYHRHDLKSKASIKLVLQIAVAGAAFLLTFVPYFERLLYGATVPLATYATILGLCLFTSFLMRTKLGQNMRAVGQNMHIARASGINVERTRIISIILSTVFASWGQLIVLQNLGSFSTYGAHSQVGQFAIAALLVGGASVQKAEIKHALLGVILFHTLFIVSPIAGKNLFDNAQLGEYFRVFVSYGVIAMSLALHAWKTVKRKPAL